MSAYYTIYTHGILYSLLPRKSSCVPGSNGIWPTRYQPSTYNIRVLFAATAAPSRVSFLFFCLSLAPSPSPSLSLSSSRPLGHPTIPNRSGTPCRTLFSVHIFWPLCVRAVPLTRVLPTLFKKIFAALALFSVKRIRRPPPPTRRASMIFSVFPGRCERRRVQRVFRHCCREFLHTIPARPSVVVRPDLIPYVDSSARVAGYNTV